MEEANLIINGKIIKGDKQVEVRNPAYPDQVVGICNAANSKQAEEAIEAAWQAYPAWRNLGIDERLRILQEASKRLESKGVEWGSLLTQEQGKILNEAIGDCQLAAVVPSVLSALVPQFKASEEPIRDEKGWYKVARNPFGVISVISPWNWPVCLTWIPVWQALLTGNTVVVKPASFTPLTVYKTFEAVYDLFPPGVINLVPGSGSEVGTVLTSHPLVRKIAFTGSTASGVDVMTKAASTIKTLSLELGGNDAAIVLDDVKLDQETLQRMLWGIFLTSGQVCMDIKRLYVHESRFDEVLNGLMDLAAQIVVGDGLNPNSTMGPINNKDQYEKVLNYIEDARKRGAKVVQVGKKLDEAAFEKGYFILPTFITGIEINAPIVCEEQFGPAIPIIPFKDDEEAIRLANDSTYGLASSVWSQDEERATKIAERLEAGYTWINQHSVTALELTAPMGGQKQSGIGRSMGLEGLMAYTESHTITSKWMK